MENYDLESLKVPPHSIEAEQSVLGGLLLDNEAFEKILGLLGEDDFYSHHHKLIYRQIIKIIDSKNPVDIVILAEELEKNKSLIQVGGIQYLGALVQNIPSSANIHRYAKIVRERSILRKLVEVCSSISEKALTPREADATSLLEEAEAKIFNIKEMRTRADEGFAKIDRILPGVINRIDEVMQSDDPNGVTGVATGYTNLDKLTSGLQRGDLVIVAGRPSMGKTAFALNIAEHVVLDAKMAVGVFSMEMPSTQLALRLLGSVGKISQSKIRSGHLDDDDWQRLTYALQKLHASPLYIDDTGGLTAQELGGKARRLKRQCESEGCELGLIIVDYLQLMNDSGATKGDTRANIVSEISRSLKSLAKDLKVPLVALSQLNRNLEQRTDRRPVMSDLRESGSIEQDADLIIFLYRDEVYNKESQDKGTAEVIIGKQRNGPIDTVRLTYIGEYTKFENYASDGNWS